MNKPTIINSDVKSLAKLSAIRGADRCIMTVYFPGSLKNNNEELEKLVKLPEELLPETELTEDELEHRERCIQIWEKVVPEIDTNQAPAWVGVISWMTDDIVFMKLPQAISPSVYLDNSPFLLPAGRLLDDFEIYAVVYADHNRASIYTAAFNELSSEASIKGAIKNHVRKGGWSQQRYERRRDKQIHHYCQNIIQRLRSIITEESLRRVIMIGDRILLNELEKEMPADLKNLIVNILPMEAGKADSEVFKETLSAAAIEEQEEEQRLLKSILAESKKGRAVVGPEDTLKALKDHRARHLLLSPMENVQFRRCGNCGWFGISEEVACKSCSDETYEQSAANEFSDLAFESGCQVEFTCDELKDIDGVGALTRW